MNVQRCLIFLIFVWSLILSFNEGVPQTKLDARHRASQSGRIPEQKVRINKAGSKSISARERKIIQAVVDESQDPGLYSVRWDSRDETGSPVSGGMYLYRLQAGSFVEVRKMLLIR